MANKLIPFKNVSDKTLNLPDLGIENLGPGEQAMIAEGYAKPRRSHAGERFPSILEQIAGCPGCPEHTKGLLADGVTPNHKSHCMLVPTNAADAARFSKAPDAPNSPLKPELPTVASLVAAGMSPGVAEVMVKGMLAAIEGAKAAQAEAEEEKTEPKVETKKTATKTAAPKATDPQ